jgi:hypothetical protein
MYISDRREINAYLGISRPTRRRLEIFLPLG